MTLAACLGTAAWADRPKTIQENGLSIAGNTAGVQKDENGQLVISENGSYEITGTWKVLWKTHRQMRLKQRFAWRMEYRRSSY